MFRFYDSNKLPIITCPSITFKNNKKEKINVSDCKKLFIKNFDNPSFMYSLSCFIEWLLYSNSPSSKEEIPIINNKKYFSQTKAIAKGTTSNIIDAEFLENVFPIIIKSPLHPQNYMDIIHEYIIAKYGTNNFRNLCPNFSYTMSIYYNNNYNLKLIQEKIVGPTFRDYIYELIYKKFDKNLAFEFLQIFIQIVLALEISQEISYFTHFDLHAENVLLKNLSEKLPLLEFQTYNLIYSLKNINKIPIIIDYGHACTMHDKGFIGKTGYNSYVEVGMYSFYVPGADLFKLIVYLWINYFHKIETKKDKPDKYLPRNFPKGSMGEKLYKFFDYCLYNFYTIQIIDPRNSRYLDPNYLSKNFYNGTKLLSIYNSPNDFLHFLHISREGILKIFELQDFPWRVYVKNKDQKINIKKNTPDIKKCFLNMFCVELTDKISNIYSHTWNETLPKDKNPIDILVKILEGKKMDAPILSINKLVPINQYLNPLADWEEYEKVCNYITTSIRKGTPIDEQLFQFFNKNYYIILYRLKTYICLKGYISYLHLFLKIPFPNLIKD